MSPKLSVAVAQVQFDVPDAPAAGLSPLRCRIPTATAQDAVVMDFLEDDLHEAELALGEVVAYLARVEEALRDPRTGPVDLALLASARRPAERLDHLGATLDGLRRRLAQIASRLA